MTEKRITVDPNRMHGLPCVRDTRVTEWPSVRELLVLSGNSG
jgi:uncharacterized protein (DUF433 family)